MLLAISFPTLHYSPSATPSSMLVLAHRLRLGHAPVLAPRAGPEGYPNSNFECSFDRNLGACVGQQMSRTEITSPVLAPGQARAGSRATRSGPSSYFERSDGTVPRARAAIPSALTGSGQARAAISSVLAAPQHARATMSSVLVALGQAQASQSRTQWGRVGSKSETSAGAVFSSQPCRAKPRESHGER